MIALLYISSLSIMGGSYNWTAWNELPIHGSDCFKTWYLWPNIIGNYKTDRCRMTQPFALTTQGLSRPTLDYWVPNLCSNGSTFCIDHPMAWSHNPRLLSTQPYDLMAPPFALTTQGHGRPTLDYWVPNPRLEWPHLCIENLRTWVAQP